MIELYELGLDAHGQYKINIKYRGKEVGKYYADIVVENCVVLELKASESLKSEHEAQLLNYLKATKYEVGLFLNFGPLPQIKRKVFSNEYKKKN